MVYHSQHAQISGVEGTKLEWEAFQGLQVLLMTSVAQVWHSHAAVSGMHALSTTHTPTALQSL